MTTVNWTHAEKQRLRDLREGGVRYCEIANHSDRFPGRTVAALRQKYAVLFSRSGVRARRNQRRSESARDLRRALKERTAADVLADQDTILAHDRPQRRSDCLPGGCNAVRPCPFVSCAHHLYLHVREETGALTFPHANREPWDLAETCALDIADRVSEKRMALGAEHTLDEIGAALNLTRERVRQLLSGSIARAAESLSTRDAQRVREALASLDSLDPDAHVAAASTLDLPRIVRHLPVVVDRPPLVRAVLDPETRALAATYSAITSPRTWLRRAAAKRTL